MRALLAGNGRGLLTLSDLLNDYRKKASVLLHIKLNDPDEAGAGIIRLWEQWLDQLTPDEIHSACPGAEVFIMANRPETGMNGTPESLAAITALHADGVLLNDIRMAIENN